MPVTVKWGNDTFHFDLPGPDTTLAAIRYSVSSHTHLPYDAFFLVHDGAVMADDNATISAYHLRPNSTISIVANTPESSSVKNTGDENTEDAQIAFINAELASVDGSLLQAHTDFLSQLTPQTRSALANERTRLSELLLQALLRLDAIIPEHDWTNARAHRKRAVNELQSLLDRLDSAWAAVTVVQA